MVLLVAPAEWSLFSPRKVLPDSQGEMLKLGRTEAKLAHQGMIQFGDYRGGEQGWLGHQPLWVSGWLEFGGGDCLAMWEHFNRVTLPAVNAAPRY